MITTGRLFTLLNSLRWMRSVKLRVRKAEAEHSALTGEGGGYEWPPQPQ
ncbi:hypothetical protein SAMN05216378_3495 [Paenibacillus catalpae]|uniref:Uncharacterized protein n=1 Tax=Paenibacillus catalpae TaxID=1045775 RepID=A0A1I2BEK2_9BACL|nr:hypothetical protein [Paenibacillus catalpae]SFE54594.1 hypothetical protein SAMN05216378_3495 [Paenibacillus catalpae]